MFQRLYRWSMRVADSPRALWALGVISFLESMILPVPVDAVSTPIMLANKGKIWLVVLIAAVTSVLGGIAGFAIGYYLYEWAAQPIIEFYAYEEQYKNIALAMQKNAWEITIVGGLTPIPYKLVAIAAGGVKIDFMVFLIASILSRGGRFIVIGGIMYVFGPPVKELIDRYTTLVGWAVIVTLVGGFAAVYWVF
jgi:membrane protein YqaA with SNARE-associated domain